MVPICAMPNGQGQFSKAPILTLITGLASPNLLSILKAILASWDKHNQNGVLKVL